MLGSNSAKKDNKFWFFFVVFAPPLRFKGKDHMKELHPNMQWRDTFKYSKQKEHNNDKNGEEK
jgi:hypothetical protein